MSDNVFESFCERHKITLASGNTGSHRAAHCTCGGKWLVWYSEVGLAWEALNNAARVHDEVESAIMTRQQYAQYASGFAEQ